MWNKKKLEDLAKKHAPHSVSILIPTERAGEEVLNEKHKLHLKNQIREVENKLENYKLNRNEIDNFLEDIRNLMDNKSIWRNASDGLAVYKSGDKLEYETLPVKFESFNYIADHLYLKPLIPVIDSDVSFFLLTLSLKSVQLYECTRYGIQSIQIENLVPEELEKVVGYDYEQKNLQVRGQQTGTGSPMYHGQGAGKDDKKPEIEKFLQYVNKGLMNYLRDFNKPLVVASVEYLYAMFRDISHYKNIYPEPIPGNPEHELPGLLLEKARPVTKKLYEESIGNAINKYNEAVTAGKSLPGIENVVPAAVSGRVDTLFVRDDINIWGRYNMETGKVELHEEKNAGNACLLNLAAVHTMLNGGKVYNLPIDDLPEKNTNVNALLRF
ncbi:MAG: hypothetical protein ACOC3S_03475 [Bacteroidota bacterium]